MSFRYPSEVVYIQTATNEGSDQDIRARSETQISSAAFTLADDTAIHNLTDLNPAGDKKPFDNQGRIPADVLNGVKVSETPNSFAKDTGAGVGKGTVPLIRLAFKDHSFQ